MVFQNSGCLRCQVPKNHVWRRNGRRVTAAVRCVAADAVAEKGSYEPDYGGWPAASELRHWPIFGD